MCTVGTGEVKSVWLSNVNQTTLDQATLDQAMLDPAMSDQAMLIKQS